MGISGSQPALMYALGGLARGGATRGGYCSGRAFVSVAGTFVDSSGTGQVEKGSLEITDELNDVPNTCTFRLEGLVPARGAEIIVTLGSRNRLTRLFAGHALRPKLVDIARGAIGSEVSAVDYTVLLHGVLVTKHYVGQSATNILIDLYTTYAPWVSLAKVPAGLPVINEITITNQPLDEATSQVMNRIGGYWLLDYHRVLRAFVDDDPQECQPRAIDDAHPTLALFEYDPDDSQLVTRCYVEGRGTKVLAAVGAGDTVVPIEAADMFEASGEIAKVAPQGSAGGAQLLTFSGVVPVGQGAFIGPGVTPSTGPTAAAAGGSGIEAGDHDYAFTWVTGAGETKPSPLARVTLGTVAAPTDVPGVTADVNHWTSQYNTGDTLQYGVSYSVNYTPAAAGESNRLTGSSFSAPNWNGGGTHAAVINVQFRVGSTPLQRYTHVWRKRNAIEWVLIYTATWNDGSLATIQDAGNLAYFWDGIGNNPDVKQASLSNIAVGPSGTTSRKVYRTAAGAAQLKLLATIADNTTTTYGPDSAADGTLGANAPTSDTSGLTQPTGQFNPGSTSIITSGGAFPSAGGWVVIGNGAQIVRYTGVAGNTLTGVPAAGIGAITAPINYGSTITPCAMLTGIPASGAGAILEDLQPGDEIYLVVQEDDLAQQGEVATRYTTSERTDDGLRSMWVQDRRLSIAEARIRGQAELARASQGILSVRYQVSDPVTASGRTAHVNLGSPRNITGDFKIQRVTISEIATQIDSDGPTKGPLDHVAQPMYMVEASNERFSLEDLLRQRRGVI